MNTFDKIVKKSATNMKHLLDVADESQPTMIGELGQSLSEALGQPSPISAEESWNEVKDRILKQDDFQKSKRRKLWLHAAAAVVALTVLSAVAWFAINEHKPKTYVLGNESTWEELPGMAITSGMESKVLADGTRFWMDAASRVTVHGDISTDSIRQLHAEGDVFFDVAHDPHRPFVVYTSRFVITVLGTKFHLHDHLSEPELVLTLYEGSVKITGENLNYRMKPGQEVRINHFTGHLTLIDHNDDEPGDTPVGYINGQLEGMKNEQLVVNVINRQFTGNTTDTIRLRNGRFNLKMHYSTVRMVSISTLRTNGREDELPQQVTLFYLPGQNVKLTGTLNQPKLQGCAFYEQQNTAFEHVYKPSRELYAQLFKRNVKSSTASRRDERKDYEQWQAKREHLALGFIRQHPDWDASASLLYEISTPNVAEALNTLSTEVKEGPMRPLVEAKQRALEHHLQQQRASELTQKGQQAPNFELRDKDGRTYRLSDMKGKYVILDFWASWCGPCKAGMPTMKSTYQKYRGKLEIFGIATWDVEEGWHRALNELQLPWPNMFTYKGTPTDVASTYAVKGLPTKFLISPKGEILLRYEGEDEEFYKEIEKIIK